MRRRPCNPPPPGPPPQGGAPGGHASDNDTDSDNASSTTSQDMTAALLSAFLQQYRAQASRIGEQHDDRHDDHEQHQGPRPEARPPSRAVQAPDTPAGANRRGVSISGEAQACVGAVAGILSRSRTGALTPDGAPSEQAQESSDRPQFPHRRRGSDCAHKRLRGYGGPESAYRLAFTDVDFLLREELRPVRMQLELLKPEMVQQEHGIQSTIVIFGSARILPARGRGGTPGPGPRRRRRRAAARADASRDVALLRRSAAFRPTRHASVTHARSAFVCGDRRRARHHGSGQPVAPSTPKAKASVSMWSCRTSRNPTPTSRRCCASSFITLRCARCTS